MRKLLLVCLLLYAPALYAAESKPPELTPYIHATKPYGQGTYSWAWIDAYDASLWTDASPWSMQKPFALVLHYHMHFTSQQLASRSIKEMQNIKPLSDTEAAGFKAQLTQLFPDVKDGDVITAFYIPHKGTQIFYNGKSTGHITNDDLSQRFMGIWLSEKTSAPALRKQLLSGQ